jgi:hypothetical protein
MFIMTQPGRSPWSEFLFGGICAFLVVQLHGLGLSARAKLAVAAPLVAIMAAFYVNSPQYVWGAPRLTLIMYIGTLMVAVLVWILVAVARILGVESNGLKTHS